MWHWPVFSDAAVCSDAPHATEAKLPALDAADLVFTTVTRLIYFGSTKGLISP